MFWDASMPRHMDPTGTRTVTDSPVEHAKSDPGSRYWTLAVAVCLAERIRHHTGTYEFSGVILNAHKDGRWRRLITFGDLCSDDHDAREKDRHLMGVWRRRRDRSTRRCRDFIWDHRTLIFLNGLCVGAANKRDCGVPTRVATSCAIALR